eukprot:6432943-Pyramimonas_sp.AAC.1
MSLKRGSGIHVQGSFRKSSTPHINNAPSSDIFVGRDGQEYLGQVIRVVVQLDWGCVAGLENVFQPRDPSIPPHNAPSGPPIMRAP